MIKVKFQVSKREDFNTAYYFYGKKFGGVNFGANVKKTLPNLKNKKQIAKEVNLFYQKNLKELKQKTKIFSKKWFKVERKYFKLIENLFNRPWPKGKYICYVGIFDCNPRHIYNKTFQTYYRKKEDLLLTFAHELLHFMFYDYFYKNFKRKLSENKLWDLSEIFNVIILNQKQFQKLLKYKEIPYPTHKRIYKKLNKIYQNSKSIKEFIEKSIKLLK